MAATLIRNQRIRLKRAYQYSEPIPGRLGVRRWMGVGAVGRYGGPSTRREGWCTVEFPGGPFGWWSMGVRVEDVEPME